MIALLLPILLATVHGLQNGLGLTPQMGWNSWNHFGCNINATVIMDAAKAMNSTGLQKLGYEYINIDDCWASKDRSSDGKLVADPKKFPNGIEGVASYVHGLGLKLGIYSDAGTKTCQGFPGSLGHEAVDAATWASWGVDYLKYDNCYNNKVSTAVRYPAMRDALAAQSRPIFYSICNWGQNNTASWAPDVGNSWRTTSDIKDTFSSMQSNFEENAKDANAASPGGWNDPDMLEIGNGGMSNIEYMTHMNLWSISKAPLIIGCDMTKMTTDTLAILGNSEVIAVNQDTLGEQATCKSGCSTMNKVLKWHPQVWSTPLSNGDTAVVVVNWGDYSVAKAVSLEEIGITEGTYIIRDLWAHQDINTTTTQWSTPKIPKHGSMFYRVRNEVRLAAN